MFHLAREVGKYGGVLTEKKLSLSLYMNSDMDKSEKFDHLHLVYHFTVFLNIPYHVKVFRGCLPQIWLGPFLNPLSQMWPKICNN